MENNEFSLSVPEEYLQICTKMVYSSSINISLQKKVGGGEGGEGIILKIALSRWYL